MHETDPEQEGVAPQAEPVRPPTFGRSPVGEDDDAAPNSIENIAIVF